MAVVRERVFWGRFTSPGCAVRGEEPEIGGRGVDAHTEADIAHGQKRIVRSEGGDAVPRTAMRRACTTAQTTM